MSSNLTLLQGAVSPLVLVAIQAHKWHIISGTDSLKILSFFPVFLQIVILDISY